MTPIQFTGYCITFGSPAVTILSEANQSLFRFVRGSDVITWTYTYWGQLIYRSGIVVYLNNHTREFQGIASHCIEGYHADILANYDECVEQSWSYQIQNFSWEKILHPENFESRYSTELCSTSF